MANKRINDLQARSSADDTVNIAGDDASQTWRITLAQVKTYIRAAIAPLATLGDTIYGGASGATTILAGNTTATKKFLTQTGTGSVSAAPAWGQPAYSDLTGWTAPTIQKFTSGSGTYTTPANVKYLRVRMIAGGGGGGGSGTGSPGTGGTGGNTTFGSTLLVANGGIGGSTPGSVPSAVSTASLGTGPIGTAVSGSQGDGGETWNLSGTNVRIIGGRGAPSPFGGGAPGGNDGTAGNAAVENTGAGGGGGGPSGSVAFGCGGGGNSGAFIDALITTVLSSYAYAVGAAGAAGTAGTSGAAGGAGGSGYIEVTEYYQ